MDAPNSGDWYNTSREMAGLEEAVAREFSPGAEEVRRRLAMGESLTDIELDLDYRENLDDYLRTIKGRLKRRNTS